MPNHYTNILILRRETEMGYEFDCNAFNSGHAKTNLCMLLLPQPEELNDKSRPHVLTDAAHNWQKSNWGTKWGTYDLTCHELPGDGSPVLIAFCTAWCPLNAAMRRKIEEWLLSTYGLGGGLWIGSDPYDDTTKTIGDDQ